MAKLVYSALKKIAPPLIRYSTIPFIRHIPRKSAAIIAIHDYESKLLYDCLAKLKENYRVIPLSVLTNDLLDDRLDSGSVAITLDDGILIQVRTIAQILEQLSLPATFFICPDFLDSDHVYWWEEVRLLLSFTSKMNIQFDGNFYSLKNKYERFSAFKKINKGFYSKSQEEIESRLVQLHKACDIGREDLPVHHSIRMAKTEDITRLMKTGLLEIGSHSMDHPWLALQTEEEIIYQVGGSKKRLELLFGKVSECFCYPYGPRESVNQKTLEVAGRFYKSAVTAQYGRVRSGDNPLLLKRVFLMPGENYSVWEAKINGVWKQVEQYL